ncbi:MAG TPA: DUF1553 domain-containing protein, partial [Candidatus Paceibacterota bacterium]|nr:DUF1553 domain-containing protein [Candidatus Paceibacterota bacterium]
FASPTMVVGERNTSTVPTQALFLLNDPFVRGQAIAAAANLKDDRDPVTRAYWLALGRPPTSAERALAKKYLAESDSGLADLIHALFASVDFRYID